MLTRNSNLVARDNDYTFEENIIKETIAINEKIGELYTDEDILNMCAVIKYLPHCGGVLSELYNTSNTTIYRLRHRLSNLEQTAKFDALPEEEQRAIYDKMCQEHNLV